ncbi:unnamed protein product [Kluyveromyces dobzhanskii CBS 2104]|uniref:WGS project CCBQ000000000 data, contig 00272 n=1 Tax=Kluyveromyces dobzhanskii CBS 2104 TaxID=1427455 RepID=A0A0A8LAQ3_9SACH|nr:unnamed protein product [Kluyveromyces dobzhanskii CBS 2104]
MPLLVSEKLKSTKAVHESLLADLETLLIQYQVPGKDLNHDKDIYTTLQKLRKCKVPKLFKASNDSSQYVPVFKDVFVENIRLLLKRLIVNLLNEIDFESNKWTSDTCEVDNRYQRMCNKVKSLDNYTMSFLPKRIGSLEDAPNNTLGGYATVTFLNEMASHLKELRRIVKSFMLEILQSSSNDQRFLFVEHIIKYNLPIEETTALKLFEETTNELIDNYIYTSDHFQRVDCLQNQIQRYCSEYPIISQNLTIRAVDTLLLRFDYFEQYFDKCIEDQTTIITILEELVDIINAYYPWRKDELNELIARTICKMLDEDRLSSFVCTYSSATKSFSSTRMAILKGMVLSALNSDIKNIEKIDRWICRVSEERSPSGLDDLVIHSCNFLNDIFPSDSKHDELLWNIYRRKYFLRSVLKSVSFSDDVIKANKRFDQQLIECGRLNSVHIFDLQQLNIEISESLKMRRASKIIPVILKKSSIADSLDTSEIAGFILPEPLKCIIDEQWGHYGVLGKNNHKTLSLQYQINLLELKSPFTYGTPAQEVILHVNLLQASILQLFNDSTHLSLQQIKEALTERMGDIPQIDKNLELFLEMNMFKKDPADRFYLNVKYKPKREALNEGKLSLYHLPKNSPKAIEHDKADNKWFTELVGACIIRTLKQRRRCTKTKLLEHVTSDFPGISRGEFKDALESCKDYYTSENGNFQYII